MSHRPATCRIWIRLGSIRPAPARRRGDRRLIRFYRREDVGGIEPELVKPHSMEAEIGGRRVQRAERAVAEQLLEARALENAVRAAEGQRGPGGPADRPTDPVFRTI